MRNALIATGALGLVAAVAIILYVYNPDVSEELSQRGSERDSESTETDASKTNDQEAKGIIPPPRPRTRARPTRELPREGRRKSPTSPRSPRSPKARLLRLPGTIRSTCRPSWPPPRRKRLPASPPRL